MRKTILCLLAGLAAWPLYAQEEQVLQAALYLSGAASEEEIPADVIDRVESARMIRVNDPHLRAGVLLTDYQVACIRDYRARSGDILSLDELALVDGFSREAVQALAPFLSLASDRLPGQADTVRLRSTVLARTTLKNVGFKGRVSAEKYRAGAAWRGSGGSFYADVTFRRHRILAGDFHTRWGQGLAAWTGFSMESLSTVDAFVRRSTGLSPVWSYAPESVHRGVAWEYSGTHVRAAAFAARGREFGAHADWLGRQGQIGLTALLADGSPAFSLDGRYYWRGALFAGELACRDRLLALRTSARGTFRSGWKWALQGRLLPRRFIGKKNGEYAFAGGLDWQSGRWVALSGRSGFGSSARSMQASLTADASVLPVPGTNPRRFQLRVYGMWQWQFSPVWLLDLRFTERYRNYEASRTDFRADLKAASGPWLGTLRLEADRCGAWGFLGYLEGGRKTDVWAAYLRLTGFSVQEWSARIYCYERDAPGTFSVPAYNGRGVAVSAVGSCKLRLGRPSWPSLWRFLSLRGNLRAACVLRAGQPPAPALNLQLQCDL